MKMVKLFFREILNAWRAKARCNVVPAERTQELFHELSFHPNEKQISEMLQTAKNLARKGSRNSNGLTFGEFCVLAADLKRFRTSTFPSTTPTSTTTVATIFNSFNESSAKLNAIKSSKLNHKIDSTDDEYDDDDGDGGEVVELRNKCNNYTHGTGTQLRSTKSLSNVEDCKKASAAAARKTASTIDASSPVEVFLGGSCNPTTWRADVAIPALKESGISFYNPQVSDWTPDLIELEHRAKEKARVLFFVMDSETRASAGAIEAAHIAGQNSQQLVLVLHPYKRKQSILNERISKHEYNDLMRNQLILKELVTRRGLPVLDNIPSGLQRTKELLSGKKEPPSNIASMLIKVRGAFDRVSPVNDSISIEQCQRALSYLGYAQSLLKFENLSKIINTQRESLDCIEQATTSTKQCAQNDYFGFDGVPVNCNSRSSSGVSCLSSSGHSLSRSSSGDIDFNFFCVISAYLSVLRQEIQESGCISPIKGTNVPPPPVYLTNMQGGEYSNISYFANKNISRTSSNASVPGSGNLTKDERHSLNEHLNRGRDSGTSSPQPLELLRSRYNLEQQQQQSALSPTATLFTSPLDSEISGGLAEEESDSNDSVFSSNSSINSVNLNYNETTLSMVDHRDVYLGGSCMLRTKWRQEIAAPYLKSRGVSFHMPALHESIKQTDLEDSDEVSESTTKPNENVTKQTTAFIRTRRKCRSNGDENVDEEEDEDEDNTLTATMTTTTTTISSNWSFPSVCMSLYNPTLLENSFILLFVITNETRSLAPMTLAAHCIGLMYNVVLSVQMLPDDCVIGGEKLTSAAIKDYNRGRSYLIDLAKRQGVPVFNDMKAALAYTVEKVKTCNSRNRS